MTLAPAPRLRRLSAEEIELWAEVARSVMPRPGARLPPVSASRAAPVVDVTQATALPVSPVRPSPAPSPALAPLERRTRQKLRRGRMDVDAVLDLHGLRAAEAHVALRRFVLGAQRDGARLVLVITGKGKFGPDGEGVLRRSVPHWLAAPELRGVIVGFEEANAPHGGAGALYVRLRRPDYAQRRP